VTARARRATPRDPRPLDWGEYAAAVHRWELITQRPAPYPTQPGRHGRPVLAPPFVEWLMGLPPGWVSAEHLDLPRTAQLRNLGNGVMPQQAAYALRLLLADLAHLQHTANHLQSGPTRGEPARPRSHAPRARAASTRPAGAASRTSSAARSRRVGSNARGR
jgi:hypothetical protein